MKTLQTTKNKLYEQILDILVGENHKTDMALLRACANWILLHAEGTANVRQYGAQVLHPKTGAPIENPWLKTVAQAEKMLFSDVMAKIKKDAAFDAAESAFQDGAK